MNHILYVTYCTTGSITDSPEVTGSVALNFPSSTSNVPSSTSDTTASQTILTEPATGSESISSPNSNSNSGAIAGGVVGAVTLIGGLVAWFTIRRRRQRRASSTDYISGQGGDTGVVPYPMEIERPRLYVSLFISLGHVKVCDNVIDLIIVLPSTLRTQVHTRRGQLQRSIFRTPVDSISALHRACNPTEWYIMAFQRFDIPKFATPILPFYNLNSLPNTKTEQFLACIPRILWLAHACGVPSGLLAYMGYLLFIQTISCLDIFVVSYSSSRIYPHRQWTMMQSTDIQTKHGLRVM